MPERACQPYPPSPWLDYKKPKPSLLQDWAHYGHVAVCLYEAVYVTTYAISVLFA